MKKLKLSIITMSVALFAATGFVSCSADYEENFTEKILDIEHSDRGAVVFPKEGGTKEIPVSVENIDFNSWTANCNADWVNVDKQAGKVVVSVGEYSSYKSRKAELVIQYGEKQSYIIPVTQMGLESIISVDEINGFYKHENSLASAMVASFDEKLDLPLITNMNVDIITVPDTVKWLTMDAEQPSAKDEKGVLHKKFTLKPNTTKDDRYCKIQFQSSQDYDALFEVIVIQSATGYYVSPVYGNQNIALSDIGSKYRVTFKKDLTDGDYTISIPEDAKEWLSVANNKVSGRQIELDSKVNTNATPRSCVVTCTPENNLDHAFTLNVTQEAFNNVAPNGIDSIKVIPNNGAFNVKWNLPSFEKINFEKIKVTISNAVNTETKVIDANETSCDIGPAYKFAGDYNISVQTVGYKGTESNTIATDKATAKPWSEKVYIDLKESQITANAQSPTNGLISNLLDKDVKTYFSTNVASSDGKPHRLDIALENPTDEIFGFEYDSRNDGNGNGDVKKVSIEGSNDGKTFTHVGDLTFATPNKRGTRFTASNDIKSSKSYRYLRFVPTAKRSSSKLNNGSAANYWDMANLYYYTLHDEAWAKKHFGK